MKKIMIAFMIVLLNINFAFSCELTVRVTEKEYPPFFMKDKDGKMTGLSVELAEALLNEAGCSPVFEPLPFRRGLISMESGKIHMMLNLSITDERKKYINFVGPQLDETVNMVIRKDSAFSLTSIDDIKILPKNIGIERGKFYGKAFELKRTKDEEFRDKIEICDNDQVSNETRLEKGLISGFLGYGYNIYYKLKTDPLYKNFTIHPYIIQQNWVYFGFSKKAVSPDMLQRLQQAYEKAKDKGLFKKIRQSYMLQ